MGYLAMGRAWALCDCNRYAALQPVARGDDEALKKQTRERTVELSPSLPYATVLRLIF
jgi:hypothetical protein